MDLDVEEFGRIAAQTAKQVILQCIREAEKDIVVNEFSDKIGKIVTGTIQNIEGNTYLVNLGKIEAFLPPHEQVRGESFNVNDRIRVYIVDIQKNTRGPVIKISRTHTGLVKELFTLEVPEIQDNIIEIINISREPGKRSKVAVKSNNPSIGPVGTCVGHMGGRIQAILKELNNEKIDIIEWKESMEEFIANSLKPAEIKEVIINEENNEATVVVPNDQLSLAIGKGRLNVRLAVKLTNCKLDIQSAEDSESTSQTSSLADKIKSSKTDESSDDTPDDTANAPTDESSDDTPDDTADAPTDESSDDTPDDTADAPTDESSDDTDDTADAPTDESSDDTPDDTADAPTDESSDDTPDDTADAPTNESDNTESAS